MATILTSTQILFSENQGRSDTVLGTYSSESHGASDSGQKMDIASEKSKASSGINDQYMLLSDTEDGGIGFQGITVSCIQGSARW